MKIKNVELRISKVTLIGLIVALLGVVLEFFTDVAYTLNDIQLFPFVLIPIGILISLLGFIVKL